MRRPGTSAGVTTALLLIISATPAAAEPGCDHAVKVGKDMVARAKVGQIGKAGELRKEMTFIVERENVSKSCQEKRLVPLMEQYIAAIKDWTEKAQKGEATFR